MFFDNLENDSPLILREDFLFISHRGFGERAYFRYQKKRTLQYVHNQLTGLELGIENGANTLELDLSKTKDGTIVTAHAFPLHKHLRQTKVEYLRKYPEALTLSELLDWIYHQDIHISLYLELKSSITIDEILSHIIVYAREIGKDIQEVSNKFYKQIILYLQDLPIVKDIIMEKQKLGLSTDQVRVAWVTLKLVTRNIVDLAAQLGGKDCRVYGIEQGMMPWGTAPFVKMLNSPIIFLPPFFQIKKHFQNLSSIVEYAQKKNLFFIVGTVNDLQWIRLLVKQGVNGVVPNDPNIFFLAGFTNQKKIELYKESGRYYVPPSMKKRLQIQ